MIKYKEITETKTEKKPTSIICDVCKKEYSFEKDFLQTQEFHCIRFTGGYDSIFGDDIRIECDICQHCLKKMIGEYCREV